MKKFKKLIPAFCMLLISAVLMGTSTYAWFSMNTRVTANGMQVTAKSDSKFLQIVAGTDTFKENEALTTAIAKNPSKQVRPVAIGSAVADDLITELTSTAKASEIKWAEAFSNDPANSTKTGKYTDVTPKATLTTEDNLYTLVNSFKVRLNEKAGATEANDLTVETVKIESTKTTAANNALRKAVRVLIVCGDSWSVWGVGTEEGTPKQLNGSSDTSVIAAKVTTTPTEINVYIFFDGEDGVTTTNNATTLGTDGYKVEFTLVIK